jgi:hypothetical protein
MPRILKTTLPHASAAAGAWALAQALGRTSAGKQPATTAPRTATVGCRVQTGNTGHPESVKEPATNDGPIHAEANIDEYAVTDLLMILLAIKPATSPNDQAMIVM